MRIFPTFAISSLTSIAILQVSPFFAAKSTKKAPLDENTKMVRNDIASIVLLAVGIFLIIALQTHLAGAVGAFIGGFLKGCFGFGAYFLPYFMIAYVLLAMVGGAIPFRFKTAVLLLILFLPRLLL